MQQQSFADDRAACIAATVTFFRALDSREHASCAASFAPSGTWQRQGVTLTGPEAVFKALEAREASRATCHVVTNAIAEAVGADNVQVRFYLTVYDGSSASSSVPPGPRLAAI